MSKDKSIVDGHRARKRFGQNFLSDEGIIEQIIGAIFPRPNDAMVEIGPGMGALTGHLLNTLTKLDVVELDRDLIPFLIAKFEATQKLTIHQADALKFDFSSLHTGTEKLRIVGNLPYNISTPLIFHLLSFHDHIKDMHFMLQKEVVDRLCAGVGDKAYGRLGIMVQYHCQTSYMLDVPPYAFEPAPKVDSAIVQLVPHATLPHPANDLDLLQKIVTAAFSARRKTIRNGLKAYATPEILEECAIDPGLRPEKVALEQFVRLTNTLTNTQNSG